MKRLFGGSERFRRNFVRLATANVVAQALGVVCLPILSRIYSPEGFATLAKVVLLQSLCLSVATLRFDWLIPNSSSSGEVRRLLGCGFLAVACYSFFCAAILHMLSDRISPFLAISKDEAFIVSWLVPFGIFFGGIFLLIQAKGIYQGDFLQISRAKILQAVVILLMSLVFGIASVVQFGLAYAYVMGGVAAVAILIPDVRDGIKNALRLSSRQIRQIFGSYKGQLTASIGLSIVNVSMTWSIFGLILVYYDSVILGWYGLVFRVASAPLGLITTGLVHSFWSDAADLAKRDPVRLKRFYCETVLRLALIALPLFVILLFGPLYIPTIFGKDEWSGAGHLLMAVSPYIFGMIVFGPTTHLIVYKRVHWQLIVDLATVFLSACAFSLVAMSKGEAWIAVLAASIVLFLGYIVRFGIHLLANRQFVKCHSELMRESSPLG